jgi:hypothetical protein
MHAALIGAALIVSLVISNASTHIVLVVSTLAADSLERLGWLRLVVTCSCSALPCSTRSGRGLVRDIHGPNRRLSTLIRGRHSATIEPRPVDA